MARQLRLSRLFYYPLARDVPQADNDPVPRQLLALLAAGLKDEAIALELGVTLRTNRQRLVSLYEQIGVHNRFQAGVAAKERGWLQASAQRCTWPDPAHPIFDTRSDSWPSRYRYVLPCCEVRLRVTSRLP